MLITNWHPNPGAGPNGWTPSYDNTKLQVRLEPQNKRYVFTNNTDQMQRVYQEMRLTPGDYMWCCYYQSNGAKPETGWLSIGPAAGTWTEWGGYNGAETSKFVELAFTVPANHTGLTQLIIKVPAGKGKIILVQAQIVMSKADFATLRTLNLPSLYFDGDTMPLGGAPDAHPARHAVRLHDWRLAA